MKEIIILSGKGGTGKTSFTASFAMLSGKDSVIADCDVDAADMHLLLKPDWQQSVDFYSGTIALIEENKCIRCGKCAEVCRFKAVFKTASAYKIARQNCEGCGYCSQICPKDAISMIEQKVGQWYVSNIKAGTIMVHARLHSGADNSGKLVARVKQEARSIAESYRKDLVIVDGSPGIGCPVISSLSGADYVVLVTEPSVSGLHDLKRVYELIHKFNIPAGCIINKADLNQEIEIEIKKFLEENNILLISSIPYNENFTRAMTQGKTIVEYDQGDLKNMITKSWDKILSVTG